MQHYKAAKKMNHYFVFKFKVIAIAHNFSTEFVTPLFAQP